MPHEDVTWHGDSWKRLSRYQFNTKAKDQLFCGKCGASIGIDFRDLHPPGKPSMFGISVSRIGSFLPPIDILRNSVS